MNPGSIAKPLAALGLALLLAAQAPVPGRAQPVCRTVTVTTSAPTGAQAAGHARRGALNEAGRLAARPTVPSTAPSTVPSAPALSPSAGVGRVLTTCQPGARARCTASVVVCR